MRFLRLNWIQQSVPVLWRPQFQQVACTYSTNKWNDINVVIKELGSIRNRYNLKTVYPETKALKELGYLDLIHAIRKKHGGFGALAQRLGAPLKPHVFESHKKVASRQNRRNKRATRIARHDLF
uniref:Uncharacterized protein AlNc14C123G6741 n=1 Tax=Albugo laibachii Nc14 TaxID=890382 RepID=F0WJL6_9STRA|nr:conserved hypothetical protein [Albugo laibachii Nc14]|eukprot:CCA21465.1 conserved hypothetical protein [Albugo laibachii Nc14]